MKILILTIALSLILNTFSQSSMSLWTYYVQPGNDMYHCNQSLPDSNGCDTLSNFAKRDNVTSNTIFIFLPGVHLFQHNMTFSVMNVTNLTLSGICTSEECPEIQCEGNEGFLFEFITNLTFEHMIFSDCGQIRIYPPYNYPHRATLRIRTVTNLYMSRVTVRNSCGYGLLAHRIYGDSVIDNCLFLNNSGTREYIGGNVAISYTNCTSESETAYFTIHSTRFLNGSFVQTSYTNFAAGLVMYFYCSGVQVTIINVTMSRNNAYPYYNPSLASRGGNLALIYHNKSASYGNAVSITESHFSYGTAKHGGGVFINYFINPNSDQSNRVKIAKSLFENNHAVLDGGGVYFQIDQGTTNGIGKNVSLFIENCTFSQNSVSSSRDTGVAVSVLNFHISKSFGSSYTQLSALFKNLMFLQNVLRNNASSASAVFYIKEQRGQAVLQNCLFEDNAASAISTYHSYLTLQGNITIRNNKAFKGGGLILCEASFLILEPTANVTIENNSVSYAGGGIYVESSCAQTNSLCFYQPSNESATPHVYLINNKADHAGSQLYGGNVELCYLQINERERLHNYFTRYFSVHNEEFDLSTISSDPDNICFCDKGIKPNCSIQSITYDRHIFSGETIQVHVALVGQNNGTVPGFIEMFLKDGRMNKFITVNNTKCATLNYTVCSERPSETIMLLVSRYTPYRTFNLKNGKKSVHVNLKRCPLGFETTSENLHCHCQSILIDHDFECFVDNQTILRPPPTWIGYLITNDSSFIPRKFQALSNGLIFNEACPFDYCHQDIVYILTNDSSFNEDQQCSYNRTGLLCGSCPPHLSSVISSSSCTDCSGYSFPVSLMLSVAFAVGGILLVVILFVCNFTVTEGTMSGLIFYANVFAVNISILLPDNDYTFLNNFAIVFLSWLNLDPGIELCFYHGLTEYHKIMGHFVFPVYLWTIAGFIILLCRRYTWASRLVGRNAVPVLATIFLLSYTKINQGIIKSLSYTTVNFPAHNNTLIPVKVWLLDTSIKYLSGKHIVLFATAIIFGVLTLLYTLFLLFIRPIQKNSHRKFLKWANKLMPLIDAYSCPHIIPEHKQFWNGLLLLLRLLLFIVVAGFEYSSPQFILCVISSSCLILFMLTWSLGGIYKKWQLNLLSSSMLLNLGLLSSITLYLLSKNPQIKHYNSKKAIKEQVFCSYLSILIVVISFIAITLLHCYKSLKSTKVFGSIVNYVHKCMNNSKRASGYRQLVEADVASSSDSEQSDNNGVDQFISEFDYREPQLADLDGN